MFALTERIKQKAYDIGFDAAGVADITQPWSAADDLRAFIREGRHGDMTWMKETLERRVTPQALWPEAQSALVVGVNYAPPDDPLRTLAYKDRATISVYARGKDYHDVLKKRLKHLARTLVKDFPCHVKVFVDTAPLMEKPLAAKAGLGWQGKHTNLVSRHWGSWLFLGVILTDMRLKPNTAHSDQCGSCQACLDICPTQAFTAPYRIDPRRCISYLTIEHKGMIPNHLRPNMGNRIYGCDDCLAVCPWNKFAQTSREIAFRHRIELTAPRLADLATLDDAAFREVFAGSPIKRIGRNRFIRNVLIALGNSKDKSKIERAARPLLTDPDPVIQDAADWALRQTITV